MVSPDEGSQQLPQSQPGATEPSRSRSSPAPGEGPQETVSTEWRGGQCPPVLEGSDVLSHALMVPKMGTHSKPLIYHDVDSAMLFIY